MGGSCCGWCVLCDVRMRVNCFGAWSGGCGDSPHSVGVVSCPPRARAAPSPCRSDAQLVAPAGLVEYIDTEEEETVMIAMNLSDLRPDNFMYRCFHTEQNCPARRCGGLGTVTLEKPCLASGTRTARSTLQ